MEESDGKEDVLGSSLWQMSARTSGSLKHTSSGRSTPRSSPRRLRPPQREFRGNYLKSQWFGGNRLVLCLALIAVWAYMGFLIQSKWTHSDASMSEFVGYNSNVDDALRMHDGKETAADSAGRHKLPVVHGDPLIWKDLQGSESTRGGVNLVTRKGPAGGNETNEPDRRTPKNHNGSVTGAQGQPRILMANNRTRYVDGKVAKRNTSYGLLVGPFGKMEDRVLGWTAEKRKGTCERNSSFAKLVQYRKFVLIFHELSMTGAPISMMELATEILICGGTVSAVALSRKGGLMAELNRRGINVLRDKGRYSFRAANRADLVVAGSAVCSSWIEEYLSYFHSRSNRVVWWIMENRREYFDRSKHVLNQVKVLMFLTESQSKQWLAWCKEDGIHLRREPTIVPLSVNDVLSFVAGIPCPLNGPSFTVEMMQAKRKLLRIGVRKEMGLTENDMLVMSLSSINPGKGQYYLLRSLQIFEKAHSAGDSQGLVSKNNISAIKKQVYPLSQKVDHNMKVLEDDLTRIDNIDEVTKRRQKRRTINALSSVNDTGSVRKEDSRGTRHLLSGQEINREPALKVLIGSVGSKSNKVQYIKEMLSFLSNYPNLSRTLLWTPATTRVSSLYAAADVYLINAQGIGETFGRVTIEAMAFGLPVLGTDAGGTKEIVEDKRTGLLHPVGLEGVEVLAKNLDFLLRNASAREQLGRNGRSKVQKMYMKHHMYGKLAVVFAECMRRRQL